VSAASWLERPILVCVGTGGVGKTTLSAALGLEGARRGRRALVLTIDPARRLADALGTGALSEEPRAIPDDALRSAGIEMRGSLEAMTLDPKRTFDRIVERYAPDEETLRRICANPIYQNLTDALAGTREYAAMEQLHEIHASGRYDLIVVDTPPARHALEFLDAPRRLTGFLSTQLLRLMFRPALAMGRTGFRLFRLGSATVLRTIERVTGLEFLRTLSEFLLAFEAMLPGFRDRALETERLLRSEACGFLLVAGPDPVQTRLARAFSRRLEREGVRLLGVVANRVRTWPGEGSPPELGPPERKRAVERLRKCLAEAEPTLDAESVASALVDAAARQSLLARRDEGALRELLESLGIRREQMRAIPLLPEDVHALPGLLQIARHVFESA
jgi:anion-transporting  ArsA/GET3 family ATPase